MTRHVSRRGALAAAVLVALAAVGLGVVRGDHRWLTVLLDSRWFPVVLAGVLLVRPLFAVPLSPFSVLVGVRYGVFPGVFVVLCGTVLTCLVPYAAGRWFREEGALFTRLARHGETFFERTSDTVGVAVSRLSPAPADAVSYAAGLSRVPLRPFVAGTLVGEAPWALGYVALGAGLSRFRVPSVPPSVLVGSAVVSAAVLVVALLASPDDEA